MHPFHSLRDHLPEMAFDLHMDQGTQGYPPIQKYLDFYHLDFPASLCQKHVMGKFSVSGYEIVAQYWVPANSSVKGTIFILHGYYDHGGLFGHLIRFLLKENFVVVIYDQPGHGLSSGEQASIDCFSEYVEVLRRCIQLSERLPRPWYAIGQSTGGAVLLHSLMIERIENPFQKMVLLAPLIRPAGWSKGVWVYRLLSPFTCQVPRRVSHNSHDPVFVEFIHFHDPLQSRHLKTAWVGAMKKWLDIFPSLEPISIKALIVQGDADETVDWRYNLQQLQQKIPPAHFYPLAGAGHHLSNEREDLRTQVFGQIKSFLLASF